MTDTAADSLSADLREYLYRTLVNTPKAERGRWVMNTEWLNECRRLDDSRGRVLWQPGEIPGYPGMIILGIPVEVRDDAGAPSLEP